MAKFHDQLDERLSAFICRQPLFFTATAPRQGGHVNCSPKGGDTLRILDDRRVAYLDLTGSGAETAAHLRENGRLTLMFCSFGEEPLILRLYGRGRVVQPNEAGWDELHRRFDPHPGERAIIVLELETVQTSCGFGVPLIDYRGQRPTLDEWARKKEGQQGLADYRAQKNARSIDGLPTGLADEPAGD